MRLQVKTQAVVLQAVHGQDGCPDVADDVKPEGRREVGERKAENESRASPVMVRGRAPQG